tara:strand:+ start:73 stop:342 length:270 start_codon:yes stop_codon:yes gene_type:complete
LSISLSVQPIGEIAPYPVIDLIIGMGADACLFKIGRFFQKKRFDLRVEFFPKKMVNNYIILTGDVIHPRQPILQTVVGVQYLKNVGECR